MVYTEIKERNKRKYYYRVISIRKKDRVQKKRLYMGVNLADNELFQKEIEADKRISPNRFKGTINGMTKKIIKVLKKYKVEKAGLFGSYSRGEERRISDVDIIIQAPKGMGIEFIRLNYDLEKILNKKVDLITYNGVDPKIKESILNQEIKII
ncbi:MAG: nucleotidyltransferase domain-containing protein [Nanoarchaeota archaeon]